MFNQATIVGNLGQDPELRKTNNGKDVCNFTVATTTGSGENKSTEWHKITAWGKLAEISHAYAQKGSTVLCQGELRTRKWQDQEGKDRYTTEIHLGGFGAIFRVIKGGKQSDQQGAPDEGDLDDEIPL